MRRRIDRALGLLALAATALASAPASAEQVEQIASGLDNPRGIALAGDRLLVAEAGGVPQGGPCVPDRERGTACLGNGGAVVAVAIADGSITPLTSGLPSFAAADGSFAEGPHAVAWAAGSVWTAIGGGPREFDPRFATLLRDGAVVADFLAHEASANPDQHRHYGVVPGRLPRNCRRTLKAQPPLAGGWYTGVVASNPYGLASLARGDLVVAEAAGNSLIGFADNALATLAVLPRIAQRLPELESVPACAWGKAYHAEPVPTAVVEGPDGYLYTTTLPGFPRQDGAGKVFRVNPRSGVTKVFASGFTSAVGLAFANDALYVTELFPGTLRKVELKQRRGRLLAGRISTAVEGLLYPHGIVAAPDGTLYVTTGSLLAGSGAIVAITSP